MVIDVDPCSVIPAQLESSNRHGKEQRKQRHSEAFTGSPPARGRRPDRSALSAAGIIPHPVKQFAADRVGVAAPPPPPNRACGFPAHGSPVGGFRIAAAQLLSTSQPVTTRGWDLHPADKASSRMHSSRKCRRHYPDRCECRRLLRFRIRGKRRSGMTDAEVARPLCVPIDRGGPASHGIPA